MITRTLENIIRKRIGKGKIIIVLGPRQVGKTTLVKEILAKYKVPALYLNGDEPDVKEVLYRKTSSELRALLGKNELVVIDEAQRIEDIGITLKLMVDNFPEIQVIATGSSSLELANVTKEPLTGRKYEYLLCPLSFHEMAEHEGLLEAKRMLNHRLIFGYYPEIINKPGEEEEHLKLLVGSYLYKDLFALQDIRKPSLLQDILQALAFQIGNEVSYLEIARLTNSDNETVERYIDLLEKAFVVFRLGSFSRNLRNELKRARKIYFWDNGIRNALISNYNPVGLRQDIGALWENFLLRERMKAIQYSGKSVNSYFWRTHAQQEIDYLEERGGQLNAYEFRWNSSRSKKIPASFTDAYPDTNAKIIDPNNFLEFLQFD